ncbi:MAG: MBL fold metallo-hydrolase [Chloroflexi bacterium]|nr:MBL fold metallo-hydrolase [Chloroflexota bacterium]
MFKRLGLLILLALLLTGACQKAPPAVSPPTLPPPAPQLRVHFVDVGQGDGIWVETWEGKSLIIDGGRRRSGFAAYLSQHRVKEIEALVGTNPDADHIGGLIEVLDSVPVRNVWISGQENTTQTFEDFVDAIARSKAAVHRARRGDRFNLGGIQVDVLHPVDPFFPGRNNNSVVLKLKFGDVSFLFAGDVEKEAEASVIAAGLPLESTVLKLGHHGSRTSTTPPFLTGVRPQVAVYQAGANNQFGHPHPETIQALRAANVRILGTDTYGTIAITTDGKTFTVRTGR